MTHVHIFEDGFMDHHCECTTLQLYADIVLEHAEACYELATFIEVLQQRIKDLKAETPYDA